MKRTSLTGQRGCATSVEECLTISASNRPYRLLLPPPRWNPVSQSCIEPITNDVMEAAE